MKDFCRLFIYPRAVCSIMLLVFAVSCGNSNYEPTSTSSASIDHPSTQLPVLHTTVDSLVVGDGGLLSKQPCGPPCLIGITAGITSRDKALEILKEKINLINCQEWDRRDAGGPYGISCGPLAITFQDSEIVNQISFEPSIRITMEDVIKMHGGPSGLFVVDDDDGRGNLISVRMILYYDAIKTRLDLTEQPGSNYLIAPDTLVENVSYLDRVEYEKSTIGYNSWHGFGEYLISTFPGDSQ